ncbi:MAG: hypothetical protein ACI85K_002078 [Hyphomicrobiaceae bacterium]|jgi:hypothetical protein
MSMWAARVDEGFMFGDLTPAAVETLKGVPMLIESSDSRVRDRLLPETCSKEEDEQHWREHAVPELERLFLSRAQLVRRDLATLRKIPDTPNSVLLVLDEHVNAWVAALNAARLALFALNDMTAEHLDVDGFDKASPKQREAILRLDMMAEMQGVMLGEYEFDDDDTDGDDADDDTEDGGSFEDFIMD